VNKKIDELTLKWKTPIIIWNDEEILWVIALLDIPKENVEQTIEKLHSMSIEVIMLTWDTKNTAEFIWSQIW
jgi:P-type E1-E2 ATPase